MQAEGPLVGEARLLAAGGGVVEVIGQQDGVDLSPRLAGVVDRQREARRPGLEVAVNVAPAERKAPVKLVFVVGRHDRLCAQLTRENVLAALANGDAERFGLLAMVNVTDPEAILAGARDD